MKTEDWTTMKTIILLTGGLIKPWKCFLFWKFFGNCILHTLSACIFDEILKRFCVWKYTFDFFYNLMDIIDIKLLVEIRRGEKVSLTWACATPLVFSSKICHIRYGSIHVFDNMLRLIIYNNFDEVSRPDNYYTGQWFELIELRSQWACRHYLSVCAGRNRLATGRKAWDN